MAPAPVTHPSRPAPGVRRYLFTLRFSVRESESDIGGARARGSRRGGGGGSGRSLAAQGDAGSSGQGAPRVWEDSSAAVAVTLARAVRRAPVSQAAQSEVKLARRCSPARGPRLSTGAQSPWAPPPPRPAPLSPSSAPRRCGPRLLAGQLLP